MCTKLLSVIGCVLVLSLCATPCSAQWIEQSEDPWIINSNTYKGTNLSYATLIADGTLNLNAGAEVGYVWLGVLSPGGTLDMRAGASALEVYAGEGTTLDFHGGWVNYVWLPTVYVPEDEPVVTVEGKDFMLQDRDGSPAYSVTEGFIPMPTWGSTLEGFYPSSAPGEPNIPIHMTFFGPVYVKLVNLEPEPEAEPDSTLNIDIKPGSDTNPINLKANGLVPVAILTTGDIEPIDPTTVRFAGAAPVHYALQDVDGDGDQDMLFHFRTQDLELNEESTEATLTAELVAPSTSRVAGQAGGGETISGKDKVQIIGSKSKK